MRSHSAHPARQSGRQPNRHPVPHAPSQRQQTHVRPPTGGTSLLGVIGFLALTGCAAEPAAELAIYDQSSGGNLYSASPDAGPPERAITVSPSALNLQAGDHAALSVVVRDREGQPASGATVSFSLSGLSSDTGLTALTVVTNEKGAASNSLQAGELGADFELRVSTVGADPSFIPVTVTPSGFGTLTGTASYAGAHTPNTLTLLAFGDVDCEGLQEHAAPAGDSLAESALQLNGGLANAEAEPTEISFFLPVLPVDESYALLAQALGPDGTVLASGCVDQLSLEENSTTTANVPLVDTPLRPHGSFDLIFTLDGRNAAEELRNRLQDAFTAQLLADLDSGTEPFAPADRQPLFLLNSLQSILSESEDETTAATQLTVASHVTAFGTYLDEPLAGPEVAIAALIAAAGAGIEEITLAGQLELAAQSPTVTAARWTPNFVAGSPSADASPTLELPTTQPRIELEASAVTWQSATPERPEGLLDFGNVDIPLPLGALSNQALRALAGQNSTPTMAERLGCNALAAFWQERPSELQAANCDEACLATACDRALSNLLTTAEQALTSPDALPIPLPEWGTVSLQFNMLDPSGDLQPDALTASDLKGQWSPTPGSPLSLPGQAEAAPPAIE